MDEQKLSRYQKNHNPVNKEPKQPKAPKQPKLSTKKNDPRARWNRILDVVLNVMLVLFILGSGIIVYIMYSGPEYDVSKIKTPEATQIFDQNNKVVANLGTENRVNVDYNKLPQSSVNALTATEDSMFFKHNGVDLLKTIQVTIGNVLGTTDAGASTVTQQLARNTFLNNDRAVTRKIREIRYATAIEKDMAKTVIMETYLNTFFYGNGNYGIQKASNYYFNKDTTSLNLVDSSMLIGILNAPTAYNPYHSLDLSTQRRNMVLSLQKRHGYITDLEYNLLKTVKIENQLMTVESSTNNANQAYIDEVVNEIMDKYDIDPYKETVKVYTYLDQTAQKEAFKLTTQDAPDKDMDNGLIAVDSQTGAIVAIGGGKHYKTEGSRLFNNATQIEKQPGSTAKPIVDYSPAFEYLHLSNKHHFEDAPYKYPGTDISVKNYDGQYMGLIPMDEALGWSRNTTALRALDMVVKKIGNEKLVEYINGFGLNIKPEDFNYSYGIGGFSYGISPETLAGAYSVFANGGFYNEPVTIKKIVKSNGKEIVNKNEKKRVIDEKTAYMMNKTLLEATNSGALMNRANVHGVDDMIKTGTSNWGEEGKAYGIPKGSSKDIWVAGYTSKYTVTVWTGYTKEGIQKGKYVSGVDENAFAAQIYKAMMSSLDNSGDKQMSMPSGLVRATFDGPYYPYQRASEYSNPSDVMTGIFYTDNVPGAAKTMDFSSLGIDVKGKKDFKVDVSFTKPNYNSDNFSRLDPDNVQYVIAQEGKATTYSKENITINVPENTNLTVYYLINGHKINSASYCYYNGNVTSGSCDPNNNNKPSEVVPSDNTPSDNKPSENKPTKPDNGNNGNGNGNDNKPSEEGNASQ